MYVDLQRGILDLFVEAAQLGIWSHRAKRRIGSFERIRRADLRRTRHRAAVLEQELSLRAWLRRGTHLVTCHLCRARVEWRVGRAKLMEHKCIGGSVRAPDKNPIDRDRVQRMRAMGMSLRCIARALGVTHPTVAAILRRS